MILSSPLARLLALALLILFQAGCCAIAPTAQQALSAASDADPIAVQESVVLGGTRQWLLIRGAHRNKPVLLFIHGGPGSPYMGFAHQFQSALEQSFVVVQWDQRGAGKSFPDTAPASMTVQQFQSDTHEMVLYLKQRFGRDRIFLLGHSWGAYLGLQEAWQHPENIHAYVGTGQMVDLLEQERQSHRWALSQAHLRQDTTAIGRLEALGEPPYPDPVKGMGEKYEWLWTYGAMLDGETGPFPFVKGMLCSPDYSLLDIAHFVQGTSFSIEQLARNEGSGFWRLRAPGPQAHFQVPVFFISGEQDRVTPAEMVKDYAQQLDAPTKQVFLIPGAGHFAFYTARERFGEAMTEVLRRTQQASQAPLR